MDAAKPNNDLVDFPESPYIPKNAETKFCSGSLRDNKQILSVSHTVPSIARQINELIRKWQLKAGLVEPITDMQRIIESARKIPPGDLRVCYMNTIVRTLGQPRVLATYLDMLRDSSMRTGTQEHDLCKKIQAARMHSVYGWCGGTILLESMKGSTEGTHKPVPGLEEMLGNTTSEWNLTIHIWQPNTKAKGFPIKGKTAQKSVLEPPHSHPFDFASMVVKGKMHQSIYQKSSQQAASSSKEIGHYNHELLEHVDGVWPPHQFRKQCTLKTLEHRVLLKEGESYYMPCNVIHDVEVNTTDAELKPAITLFLSSEYMVKPHAYISKSMADYHAVNPDLKSNAKTILESSWHEKLKAISEYLRSETTTLDLNKIVNYSGEYAFFHI